MAGFDGRRAVLAGGVVLALASPALADVGVPMLAVVWPASWILLVPIIVVEWLVARRVVPAPVKKTLKGVALANVISTLVGIPVTWFILAVVAFLSSAFGGWLGHGSTAAKLWTITLGAAWLNPFESDFNYDWMVPAAALFLLVPFYFMSVAVEARVFQRVTDCPRDLAWRWSRLANAASYGCLLVLVAGALVHALATHGRS